MYFLGKVEDNSKPVEPHWLMKERSLTESKPDPKKSIQTRFTSNAVMMNPGHSHWNK